MSYSRIDEIRDVPNLIEVQKKSYQAFLDEGLREIFKDVSPIMDYTGNLILDFLDYSLDEKPKYSVEECKERDATYSARLMAKVRLINKDTGEVKEQETFMGDFPLMTETGTFIVNGAERVIVSQLVRSPGVYYTYEIDRTGKKLFSNTVIPYRGAWLEYETDSNDKMHVRIDRTRKLPLTLLLKALGYGSEEDIIDLLGDDERVTATLTADTKKSKDEALVEIYKRLRPGEPPTVDSADSLLKSLFFDPKRYDLAKFGRFKFNKKLSIAKRIEGFESALTVVNPLTGEIIVDAGDIITEDLAKQIQNAGVNRVSVTVEGKPVKVVGNNTVNIYAHIKPSIACRIQNEECCEDVVHPLTGEIIVSKGETISTEVAEQIQELCILDKEPRINYVCINVEGKPQQVYSISDRKIDEKWVNWDKLKPILAIETVEEQRVEIDLRYDELVPRNITIDDIVASVSYLNNLNYGIGTTDDIDHLGNRRLRSVGELLQNQFRIGLSRLERVVKERMTIQDLDIVTPQALINIRPIVAAIKEFFGSSQLSQFMDQTNPLAELTHKRRLSALGPGGLNRDRASFEVRDVHYSHYSRMCPIETPEGPNIGLIGYLSTYARINPYGFIEVPYRKIDDEGRVTDIIEYMTADEEEKYQIAQATEKIGPDGKFENKKHIEIRRKEDIIEVESDQVDYMDVSPKQVVSIATAMIPFLENDDASRALMGSNMQRQAVPLIKTEAPIIGTGMEYKAAYDSGVVIVAKNDGIVERIYADKIVIRNIEGDEDEYRLIKYKRSNQGTCINQRPIVNKGDVIQKGEVIADGPSTDMGEISLGRNILIGFMTWEGYNYEDAILISEKLVKEDVFTSIHIEEYEAEARDTKLGPEEITNDIPNVSDESLKDLDETGIIRIGAEVRSGDILVGKVTPKGETELTAEERLLRAIFGEKAREVRDTSLRVPHGESGIIVDVKVFTRENGDELSPGVNQLVRVYIAQKRKISVGDKMAGRHGNKGVISRILPEEDMPFLPDGTPLEIVLNPLGVPSRMNIGQVLEVHLGYAAKALGWKIATPVFDGATENDILETLKMAGYPESGKMTLYDGRTGDAFDNKVTVGYMYIMKLAHLVDDKIHARSTGPYSLVTQQPLGGKAQFGGQRFGEMEVWALEAYGAAYSLQEILTVKSDDVVGRVKTYEAIVKGENVPEPGIPESFKVLIKELQSLALDVTLKDENRNDILIKDSSDEEFEDEAMNLDIIDAEALLKGEDEEDEDVDIGELIQNGVILNDDQLDDVAEADETDQGDGLDIDSYTIDAEVAGIGAEAAEAIVDTADLPLFDVDAMAAKPKKKPAKAADVKIEPELEAETPIPEEEAKSVKKVKKVKKDGTE